VLLELEWQPEDGALILKASGRLIDFFDTLQEACEKFSPDNADCNGIIPRVRAYSKTGVQR
jgi:hypothetical protein